MKEDEVVSLTKELVRFNTVYLESDESVCLSFLADHLGRAGFKPEMYRYSDTGCCLICQTGEFEDLPIVLSGHIDTVPAAPDLWDTNPWLGHISDGKLYGRGTSDMKGGIAAMVLAFEQLKNLGRLKKGALLVITGGEEGGDDGAKCILLVSCVF